MNILFITSGQLPVPAVEGGAVETLLDSYINQNESQGSNLLTVLSCTPQKELNNKYIFEKTEFVFVNNKLIDIIKDRLLFFWYTYITKDWRVMFYKNKYKKLRFEKYISEKLDLSTFDKVVVENNMSLLPIIRKKMGDKMFSERCYYHMHSVLIDNPIVIPELNLCQGILTVSEYVKKQIQIDHPELKNATINVVKNGINSCNFNRLSNIDELRNRYKYSKDDIIYLYVGRISPEKGTVNLVRAFKQMQLKNKKLLIVGCSYQGDKKISFYEKEVRQEIKGYEKDIQQIGYIDNCEVEKVYNMADIVVIPSITGDAGPLNLLEAMSCQATIIASNIGGIPEYSKQYKKMNYVEYNDEFNNNLCEVMTEVGNKFKEFSEISDTSIYDEKFYFTQMNTGLNIQEHGQ